MSDDDVMIGCDVKEAIRNAQLVGELRAQLQTERELFESTIRLKDEIAKHRNEAEAKRDQLYADLDALRAQLATAEHDKSARETTCGRHRAEIEMLNSALAFAVTEGTAIRSRADALEDGLRQVIANKACNSLGCALIAEAALKGKSDGQ